MKVTDFLLLSCQSHLAEDLTQQDISACFLMLDGILGTTGLRFFLGLHKKNNTAQASRLEVVLKFYKSLFGVEKLLQKAIIVRMTNDTPANYLKLSFNLTSNFN